jgi:hypothetical protein
MDTTTQEHASCAVSPLITGKQRLALWKEAQKKLRDKLDPKELAKMRDEWEREHPGMRS